MANRKHLINVHTSTGTEAPTGASLYLGEIAVQHTPNEPAIWIKMGSAETSTEYEKFIGETEINQLISSGGPFVSGEGENSAQQKGTGAAATSEASVAMGKNTFVGQKAYKYTNTGSVTNQLTLTSVNGLSVGDVVSIVNDSKYPNCSTITEINGTTLTFDSLPFDSIVPDLTGFDDYLVYVSAKPNVGDIELAIAAHAEGDGAKAQNYTAHAEGRDTKALGNYSHAEGRQTIAQYASHAEGRGTEAVGDCSHSEGQSTKASGNRSHAEGNGTISDDFASHTEGYGTVVSNNNISATVNNNASGAAYSHAEGNGVLVSNHSSHGEGRGVKVTGNSAHGEGLKTTAEGNASHAEGNLSVTNGSSSHAEGYSTFTLNYAEHAEGRYNKSNKSSNTYGNAGNTQHSVGIGTSDTARKNAFEIMQNGDAYLVGVGGYSGTSIGNGILTLQEVLNSIPDNTLGSGYTYSGLSYIDSSTTIADAFSALTNELIKDEKVTAAALNELNVKTNEIDSIKRIISEDEEVTAGAINALNERVGTVETHMSGDYIQITGYQLASGSTEEELTLNEEDTVDEAFGKLQKQMLDNEEAIAAGFNDLNNKVDGLEEQVKENSGAVMTLSAATSAGFDYLTEEINSISAKTSGVLTLNLNGVEQGQYCPSASTTINLEAIQEVTGADVLLTGYELATGSTEEELVVLATDTVNEAFGKLQKQNYDNESVVAGALNDLDERVAALEEDGSVEELSAATIALSAATVEVESGLTIISGVVIDTSYVVARSLNDLNGRADALSGVTEEISDNLETLSGVVIDNELVTASALIDLNGKINELSGNTGISELSAATINIKDGLETLSGVTEDVASLWERGMGSSSVQQKGSNGTALGDNSVVEGASVTNAIERGITSASTDNEIIAEWSGSTPDTDKFSLAKGEASHVEGNNNLALGKNSHAEGNGTISSNNSSHAEGTGTQALGKYAHAEGLEAFAEGERSHAEGAWTKAIYYESHAEGQYSEARARASHAEGYKSITSKEGYGSNTLEPHAQGTGTSSWVNACSHAEGNATIAQGLGAHAEGEKTFANDRATHAEGINTVAGTGTRPTADADTTAGKYSHAEGNGTQASGNSSHAEGRHTLAGGESSHVEGRENIASGNRSHAEGMGTQAKGNQSHSEGNDTVANAWASHTEGYNTETGGGYSSNTKTPDTDDKNGDTAHAEGNATIAKGAASHSEGIITFASGKASHAEGNATNAKGDGSHAEGISTIASGTYSHAEGEGTTASGYCSHAEGMRTTASGSRSHAEGNDTAARGNYSHAEGNSTNANGEHSHAEGLSSIASGRCSHAEGCQTTASGNYSHAEGRNTTASEEYSHAEGYDTTTLNKSEHAEGQYNVSHSATTTYGNSGNTQHSVGIGNSGSERKNAFEIMQNGDAYLYGVGGYDGTNSTASTSSTLQQVLSNIGCFTEITWSALKTLRDGSGLTPGMQYRITDYNCTTVQQDTQSANHPFDIIVVADDNHTLNENARAVLHSGDTYFSTAGAKLEAWELKYDLDNDTTKYAWADSGSTGRGVIYWMKDEWNNECPYDFKNIQFARWEQTNPVGYVLDEDEWEYVQDSDQSWTSEYNVKAGFYSTNGSSSDVMLFYNNDLGDYKKKISYTVSSTPTYCYTFGRELDASLGKQVYSNVIKEYYNSNKLQLNNIVFLQTALTQNCHANTFGHDCYDNTFGNGCCNNAFGNGCYDNIFKDGCYDNIFKDGCYDNIFKDGCYDNTFGGYCYDNIFKGGCNCNTFGNNCYANTFENDCFYNIFKDGCYANTFGYGCYDNAFGCGCYDNIFKDGCYDNTFGNYCNYNTFGGDCYYNTFGNSCTYNTFGNCFQSSTFGEYVQSFIIGNATGATTSAQTKNYIQYLIVENGVQNVNAYCTGTTSDESYCQNIKIGLGVKGTSLSNRLQIDITPQIGATASVTYQPANSQIINI